jgi:hypothetical protein
MTCHDSIRFSISNSTEISYYKKKYLFTIKFQAIFGGLAKYWRVEFEISFNPPPAPGPPSKKSNWISTPKINNLIILEIGFLQILNWITPLVLLQTLKFTLNKDPDFNHKPWSWILTLNPDPESWLWILTLNPDPESWPWILTLNYYPEAEFG